MASSIWVSDRKNIWLAGLYVAIASVGSVTILEVHTHHGLIAGIIYALGLAIFLWWLLTRQPASLIVRALGSLAPCLVVLALLAVVDRQHLVEPSTKRIR